MNERLSDVYDSPSVLRLGLVLIVWLNLYCNSYACSTRSCLELPSLERGRSHFDGWYNSGYPFGAVATLLRHGVFANHMNFVVIARSGFLLDFYLVGLAMLRYQIGSNRLIR